LLGLLADAAGEGWVSGAGEYFPAGIVDGGLVKPDEGARDEPGL